MTTYTPGPWVPIRTPESTYFDYQIRIGRDRVGVYSEADSRLIAAAPDLLEALIAMENEKTEYMTRNHLGDPSKEATNKMARDAIAKAIGDPS